MDQFLAELYGTNEPGAEDFEKVAHLDFLEKVAEEEGIDLNDLSDEDLEELADIAADALDEIDEDYEEDDFEKEAEAKVEEADFLGRVMAHSFNQEMDMIEKEAGVRGAIGRGYGAVKGKAQAAYGAAKPFAREAYGRGRNVAKVQAKGKGFVDKMRDIASLGPHRRAAVAATTPSTLGGKIDRAARRLGQRLGAKSTARGAAEGAAAGARAGYRQARPGGRARRALDFLRQGRSHRAMRGATSGAMEGGRAAMKSQRRRGYGAAAAGLGLAGAGAGGAAYMAGREKKSADEQWEDAVQARAWEHLMAAGLADNTGNYIPATELDFGKTAADEDLEYNLDADALELLEAEGYPVEWY